MGENVPLTPEEANSYANQMAELIASKLQSQHVIPGEFGSDIGAWIRELNHERDWYSTFVITMGTYNTPVFHVTMLASGAIKLEFRDINGQTFWQGTIQPVGMRMMP